ncbi:MAG: DHH family phosphoesterase [Planctomycetes bacterium]|nr:DHH family phosphoesterase [Planctomycetota bacterium]
MGGSGWYLSPAEPRRPDPETAGSATRRVRPREVAPAPGPDRREDQAAMNPGSPTPPSSLDGAATTRTWRLPEGADQASDEQAAALARRLGLPTTVARLLHQRGFGEEVTARTFLDPRLEHLRPPRGLPDIDRAARRVADAVTNNERIAVCGDYDVDGMTGTSLLVRFFRLLGADAHWAIPDRNEDGYGLSAAMIDRLIDIGARVVITVDNGVSAHAALERAAEAGLDVIVTDHHLPGPTLPPAHALVVPHLARDGDEDNRHLCGCALAFKLAWAVADRCRARLGADGARRFKTFLRDAMGLVALATLADQMPLRGENRVLVAAGLASVRGSEHAGLAALREVAEVGATPITTEDVAFRIAPRLNAAGRLSRPELVVELLTCDDPAEARRLAHALDAANRERREIESRVLDEALAQAEAAVGEHNQPGLARRRPGLARGRRRHRGRAPLGPLPAPLVGGALDGDQVAARGRTARHRPPCGAGACAQGPERFWRCHAMAAGSRCLTSSTRCARARRAVRARSRRQAPTWPSLLLDGECSGRRGRSTPSTRSGVWSPSASNLSLCSCLQMRRWPEHCASLQPRVPAVLGARHGVRLARGRLATPRPV